MVQSENEAEMFILWLHKLHGM